MTSMHTTTGLPKGWTLASAHEAIIESVIDHHRFANLGDRALALHEGDEGHELFPSSEELSARGVNLETLVTAFNNGLTGEGFFVLLSAMSADGVNDTLDALVTAFGNGLTGEGFAELLTTRPLDGLTGDLELFNEHHQDIARHPRVIDRIAHRYGECSCH